MKTRFNQIISFLTISIVMLACNGRPTQEMLAREKAMTEIKEAEQAIDEYLLLIELNYKHLLDERTSELSRAIEELKEDLEDSQTIKKTEERIKMLKKQRKELDQKLEMMRSACEGGCDDFSDRINQIFDELDQHLSAVDSLLVSQ